MGANSAKPSEYVKKQWIDDRDTNCCFDCRKVFSATRRRHHCRCCGEIYCGDCWGSLVRLPPDYGYDVEVPVCNACQMLFSGSLKFLRLPRRIVLTRALKDNQKEEPPLSKENARTNNFEVFFVKVAHWRPFTDVTHLQFSITLRTANGNNSSHFNQTTTHSKDVVKPSPGLIPMMSDLNLEAKGLKAGQRRNSDDFIDLIEGDRSKQPQAASSSGSSSRKKREAKSPNTLSLPGAKDEPEVVSKISELRGLQLDIAWTLPLDALLRVMLDAHEDGDYITLETAQEHYRIQCADIQGPITAEQKQNSLEGAFRLSKKNTTTKKTPTIAVDESDMPVAEESPRTGSPPPKTRTQSPPKKEKKRVTMAKDDGDGDSAKGTQEPVLTSAPLPGAVFTPNEADTRNLFMELQVAVKIMMDRQQAREARRNRHQAGGKPPSPHGSVGAASGAGGPNQRIPVSPGGTRSNRSFASNN